MQRGVVGATNLNLSLQEALNPPEHDIFMRGRGKVTMPKECLRRSGYAFRADDKVMKIKNNYDKEVFNGDSGFIDSIYLEQKIVYVRFDERVVEYTYPDLEELSLAYAMTIVENGIAVDKEIIEQGYDLVNG